MTAFAGWSLLLLAVAGLFVAPPLWRPGVAQGQPPQPPQRWTAVWLMTGLLALTGGLYAWVGTPDGLDHVLTPPDPGALARDAAAPSEPAPPSPAKAPEMTQAQIEGMVARLAQRLQDQPEDAQGWRMLARSYETLGRFDQAAQAYRRLLSLVKPDADLLTDYAVTLGMSQGQTLVGEPEAVIAQALQLDPKHIQALALSGSAAFEKHAYAQAMAQWQTLLDLIPSDAEIRSSIEGNIAKARSLAEKDRASAQP